MTTVDDPLPEDVPVFAFLHHPQDLSSRSGMFPLAEALGATPVYYGASWWFVQQHSWRAGEWLKRAGCRYYGSAWNTLVPVWDEIRLARRLPRRDRHVAHFLWGEFARPRQVSLFRRATNRVVATFHASASRLPEILAGARGLQRLDGITLMSKAQEPFFLERGVERHRIRTVLHGVDIRHFRPPAARTRREGPLRGFLIGVTERDHAFMADVMRALPAGVLELDVATSDVQWRNYAGVPGVKALPRLSDAELVRNYQDADVLMMPVRDCTANNSVLEAMACGTPVMINRIGGVPEYVDASCNFVLQDKKVEAWVDALVDARRRGDDLLRMRPQVRAWAERFDWREMAKEYRAFYATL